MTKKPKNEKPNGLECLDLYTVPSLSACTANIDSFLKLSSKCIFLNAILK